ncbi:HNH endonuclease [Indivirus ILV1]|uniref:HNH endonuclease n=1 Tax=Indivirus ILV1 TaxID=1977633 RepID=A0A1V0SDQ2_9VIRU|nr:HNH endonuclease [Indivirus ILV1]
MEIWKKIQDIDYYISNYGNFKQKINDEEKLIDGWIDKYGYRLVSYYLDKTRKREFVHRLVASYFVDKLDPDFNIVNHIDGNKTNSHYSNLECMFKERWQTKKL